MSILRARVAIAGNSARNGPQVRHDASERQVHDETQAECDAEDGNRARGRMESSLDGHTDQRGDHDEQVRARELPEERYSEHALQRVPEPGRPRDDGLRGGG